MLRRPMVVIYGPDDVVRIVPLRAARRERASRWWWLVVAALAALCLACAPEPRRPAPSVGDTLVRLDRIERGILVHEITVRDWRAAR